jgi:hypothetical protein
MDSDYYADKVGAMLMNHNTYEKVQTDSDLEKHNITTEDEADYITNFEHKTAICYGLPQIHKSSTIIKAIQEQKSTRFYIGWCKTHHGKQLISV